MKRQVEQTVARGAKAKPELVFRAMWPTEALIDLVREQDGLYRGVVRVDAEPSSVTITKAGQYRVEAHSRVRGTSRSGCAEHATVDRAIREAYTELLRRTVNSDAQASPCACAA